MKIEPARILHTQHLLLRYPELDDAAQILSVVQSAQFPERLPLKELSSKNQVEGWLKMLQEGWAAGRVFSWILENRQSGDVVGQVTLSRLEGENLWSLAFWIHPDHWDKGYATEGAERILAFGFEQLGAEKVWAGAGVWNLASCRVLEKTGMICVGENPQGYTSKGEPIPTREYEISQERWRKNPRSQGRPAGW